jgi:transposase
MVKSYRGSGSANYHPALLLDLVVYGYTTGVFSSRKLERATPALGRTSLRTKRYSTKPTPRNTVP